MPQFARVSGGATPVAATGSTAISGAETTGVIISTGIGKPVQGFNCVANASIAAQMGANEAVEAALRAVGSTSTVLAYEVNDVNLSILIEEGPFTAATLQANLNAATAAYSWTVTDTGLDLS